MNNFIFTKITSPFKNEFKGEVEYIELPTISGIIGILPNHMPFISALKTGVLKLRIQGGEVLQFEVNGGFVRFVGNKCLMSIKNIKKLDKTA